MEVPELPFDTVHAALGMIDQRRVLVRAPNITALSPLLDDLQVAHWRLYYGFGHITNPYNYIFPAYLVTDYGDEFRGLDAITFIARSGQRFPRAEIWGQHAGGKRAEYFVRDLELSLPMIAFAAVDDDFPGQRLAGAFELTPFNDDLVLAPGGVWPDALKLCVPAYLMDSALDDTILAPLLQHLLNRHATAPAANLTLHRADLSSLLAE